MQIEQHKTDILILGTGGAGLFAALHAKKANPDLRVTVTVKGLLGKCGCTRMVQGGYNVALSAGDSVERHFMDTIEAESGCHGRTWPGAWSRAVERARAGNEIGCFLTAIPTARCIQGLRRPELRPHRAQGRPDRHRDHQPADGAGAVDVEELEEHRAIELIPAADGSGIAGVLFIDMRTGGYR